MDLSTLNTQQQEAVLNTYHRNTSLVAGAGSGKTTVIKNRTAYMIQELGISPKSIMIVTFTNKAAREIKERIATVTEFSDEMWLGTFHSICVRILRQFGRGINLNRFTILDDKDSTSILKEVAKEIDPFLENDQLDKLKTKISKLKSELRPAQALLNQANKTSEDVLLANVYKAYQEHNLQARTLDFDDLIYYTVVLLQRDETVRKWFHENVKYISVDESQDTATSQFQLIKLLVGPNNLMMVGDDDQSIYSFRNAKPEYLIQFQKMFPNTQVLRLEQNYRSSGSIIDASNQVIKQNKIRTLKTMFTHQSHGDLITMHVCEDTFAEAKWIADMIDLRISIGCENEYEDVAILFRKKSQSNAIERALLEAKIPYCVLGASFYDRAVIKDILAFLKLKVNPKDDIAFKRVLAQIPGIGKTTVKQLLNFAKENRFNYIRTLREFPFKPKIKPLADIYTMLLSEDVTEVSQFLEHILTVTSKRERFIDSNTETGHQNLALIVELESIIQSLESESQLTLEDFLAAVSLQTDKKDKNAGVTLMTIHSAKGLEFQTVYLIGAEDGIIPLKQTFNNPDGLEEERRLMYVAMTRAKENLFITRCLERSEYGQVTSNCSPSRFLKDIPSSCLEEI